MLTLLLQNSQILFQNLFLREYSGIIIFFSQSVQKHTTFPLKFSFTSIREKLESA